MQLSYLHLSWSLEVKKNLFPSFSEKISTSQISFQLLYSPDEKTRRKELRTTASDLFSGHGYSGNDGFSGTKPLDDAISFTNNSGITA